MSKDASKKPDERVLDFAPELELAHPLAPWRQGGYEHLEGVTYPDIGETKPATLLREAYPNHVLAFKGYRGDACVLVKKECILEMLKFLRDHPDLRMDLCRDIFGVDNQRTPERIQEFSDAGLTGVRFEVIYSVYSLRFRHALRLRAGITEVDCKIDSAHKLYKAADWFERETWEMFGIVFDGHPNLKRLMTHANFEGFPLRKDYPIRRRHNIKTPIEL